MKRKVGSVEKWQVYRISGELLAEYAANTAASTPQKEYGYRNGQLLITATSGAGYGAPPVLHDNPLVVGETTVQARHITELRDAINTLRARLGMSAYSWTKPTATNGAINVGDWITADPISEMRTALNQTLGPPANGYSPDLAQGQPIKAIHIQELRDRLMGIWSSDIRWLVSDQLGTPRMVFDQSGSLSTTSRHDYLPFGEEIYAGTGGRTTQLGFTNGDGARQKFINKERDIETGLDYFEARYYSSTQGRFTTVDPLYFQLMMAIDPQRFNLYGYGRNNPMKWIDPDGEKLYLRGDMNWLETNVLYQMTGSQQDFDQYFEIKDGQVVLKAGVDISKANEGVKELAGLVGDSENYIFFAGPDPKNLAALLQGAPDSKGKPKSIDKPIGNEFAAADGRTTGGGTFTRTSGRQTDMTPANLANGDPVFAVIAYNTNASQKQEATISSGFPDVEADVQKAGFGQTIKPVGMFIHESTENREFARQRRAGQPFDYNSAHTYAMHREAAIRKSVGITGGFAGGAILTTIEKKK